MSCSRGSSHLLHFFMEIWMSFIYCIYCFPICCCCGYLIHTWSFTVIIYLKQLHSLPLYCSCMLYSSQLAFIYFFSCCPSCSEDHSKDYLVCSIVKPLLNFRICPVEFIYATHATAKLLYFLLITYSCSNPFLGNWQVDGAEDNETIAQRGKATATALKPWMAVQLQWSCMKNSSIIFCFLLEAM